MVLNLLRIAGMFAIILSVGALASPSEAALDAQCVKRCRCSAAPCGTINACQDGFGVWTRCCDWCKS